MDATDEQIEEKFASFSREQDSRWIYEALEILEANERILPFGDKAGRQRAIARRLRFFAHLDRLIDPDWDAGKLPPQGVPPPISNVPVFSSGEIDPADIPDAEMRARYERSLRDNKDELRRYSVQDELRRLDADAMLFTDRLIVDAGLSREELDDLLAASTANESRKERLRNLNAEKQS